MKDAEAICFTIELLCGLTLKCEADEYAVYIILKGKRVNIDAIASRIKDIADTQLALPEDNQGNDNVPYMITPCAGVTIEVYSPHFKPMLKIMNSMFLWEELIVELERKVNRDLHGLIYHAKNDEVLEPVTDIEYREAAKQVMEMYNIFRSEGWQDEKAFRLCMFYLDKLWTLNNKE